MKIIISKNVYSYLFMVLLIPLILLIFLIPLIPCKQYCIIYMLQITKIWNINKQTNNNSNILYDVYVTKIRSIYSTMLHILITKQILKYIYNTIFDGKLYFYK